MPGADLGDVPAGIMAAGSVGGIIAISVCIISGFFLSHYRAKKWSQKSVVLSGVLGPSIGITGAIIGLMFKSSILLILLLVTGMPIGVSLGRKIGEENKGA